MNILKLQDQLKGLPDNALINYVQNPTGEVPTYLALGELERRKTLREQYQTDQQAPTSTVAQDLAQPAGMPAMMQAPQQMPQQMPQAQGMPAMDTGGMFKEENFAGGGIVAFDDGGSVMDSLSGMTKKEAAALLDWLHGMPANMVNRALESGNIGLRELARQFGYNKALPPIKMPRVGGTDSLTPYYDKLRTQQPVAPQVGATVSNADRLAAGQIANEALNQPSIMDRLIANVPDVAAPTAKKATMAPAVGVATKVDRTPVAPTAAPAGLQALYTPPEDMSALYEQQLRPATSAESAMEKYRSLIGADAGRAKMEERLAAMEERAGKEAERAPWMALTKAGLSMAAGKSPFALQNIAAGGTEGLKDYAEAQDRLEKSSERRFDLQSRIAQAERAEQVAAATYGLNSEERNQAHNEAVKLKQLDYKAGRAQDKANKDFEAAKFGVEEGRKNRELNITEKHYNDWYRVSMAQAEKSLQGIEKQTKAQQTSILNNLLDEAVRQQKEAREAMDDKQVASIQGRIAAIQKKMFELTGVEYTPAPTVSGPRSRPIGSFEKK